jgi:hypothetical protein
LHFLFLHEVDHSDLCGFAGRLLAENRHPFASYRQAVDSQLWAIFDHRQVFRHEVREAVRAPQSAQAEP